VIPEDWKVTKLGEVADVKTGPFGSALHEKDYVDDGTPIITVEHLDEQGVIYANLPMVSDLDRKRLNAYSLIKGDIVFSRVGSVDRNSLIKEEEIGWLFSGRLLRIRLKTSDVYSPYLSYYFNQESTKQRIRAVAVGQTMASLNTQILKNIDIAFPTTKSEQIAIATILSDIDALIVSLDSLIAKKRDIKQATMQQLLIGKMRLPGFSEEWQSFNMANNSTLKARIGWQGLTTAEYLKEGEYYLVTGTDFIDGQIAWDTCHFVDAKRYDQDKNIQLRVGDVLLTKDGTIGKVAYINHLPNVSTLNSGVFVIRPNNKYYSLYLYYVLSSSIFDIFLNQLKAGSTISHLYQKDFVGFNFLSPSWEEQKAIATILSDMDTEIAALEQKRDKTRTLKQGMMHELLTGKTRLV